MKKWGRGERKKRGTPFFAVARKKEKSFFPRKRGEENQREGIRRIVIFSFLPLELQAVAIKEKEGGVTRP